jgi:hypothetical protein
MCSTVGCGNTPQKGRRYCQSCNNRKWRQKHPIKAAFNNLKQNAKRRGIWFDLTFQAFKRFCKDTAYVKLKGTGPDDMTIDRVIPAKGYVDGNLQMISKAENSIKQHTDKARFWDEYYASKNEIVDPGATVEVYRGEEPPF